MHHTEQAQYRRGEQHNARVAEQLPHHLLAYILIGADAGHNHTRRGGDYQRRDLRHQTITNGQQRIAFRCVAHVHAVLQHADKQAADYVNHHDQNARDGVTAHKLTRTVHGAVEICLLGHFGTAFLLHLPRSARHSGRRRWPSAYPASRRARSARLLLRYAPHL